MYYVNQEQIDARLAFVPELLQACAALESAWEARGKTGVKEADSELLLHFAQERTLHLAIETVTDVGSLLIDAFMMRDASSYEDIVEILAGEGVFGADVALVLTELVKLRRPLTQEYNTLPRSGLHPTIAKLPGALSAFADAVPAFIRKEML
ncbi:DUF86 domain-containing protein [Paenibacillus ehimensis]|uniref:DUF86 domain-containing protein n=1 Tax=Paenibacillus ehimensis TaxID=79264 RepID=A0ABT8VC02_9BACL|nr:HepT-like ribonuclease domain-containing protein [Paenibacillus ehimensis]MDO3678481.1 DUF86 domain-containing protein [Paenibacillus ehimensis]MEC0213968.1 DUF86 domain-containing protein [Paenibacillus ehimensis]